MLWHTRYILVCDIFIFTAIFWTFRWINSDFSDPYQAVLHLVSQPLLKRLGSLPLQRLTYTSIIIVDLLVFQFYIPADVIFCVNPCIFDGFNLNTFNLNSQALSLPAGSYSQIFLSRKVTIVVQQQRVPSRFPLYFCYLF